jgi:hypothetical protein
LLLRLAVGQSLAELGQWKPAAGKNNECYPKQEYLGQRISIDGRTVNGRRTFLGCQGL